MNWACGISCFALAAAILCGCRSAADVATAPPALQRVVAEKPPESPIRLASAAVRQEPQKDAEQKAAPKEKIDLPTAIQLCTLQNFRLQASATKIAQAEADLLTASIIPNPTWFNDIQLLPLQRANFQNQLGPPQQDSIVTIPVDWLLFGKRAAAVQAQQLGVAVARAGQDDAIRKAVSDTVDTFYAILQAEEMLRLAEEDYEDAKQLEESVNKLAQAGKAGETERARVRLLVLDASMAAGARESELRKAKIKLRPLIGRTASDPDFDVVGTLEVKAVVPPPELKDAIALAEARRPDVASSRFVIDQATANIHSEQKKAKPQVAISPGWSYQYQRPISGFRNGSMIDAGLTVTLPITDRNQGAIRKAEWQLAEARLTYQANVADLRAEVEATVASYADAVDDVTKNDDPATVRSALEIRKKTDAEFLAGRQQLSEVIEARKLSQSWKSKHVEFRATYWRALNQLNTVVGLNPSDPAAGAKVPVEYGKEKEPKK
jgi:cobalt-zinc-cadmium efflux system outer membrane protein